MDVAIDGITVENDSLYPLLKVFYNAMFCIKFNIMHVSQCGIGVF